MAAPRPPGGGTTPWSRLAPRLAFGCLGLWAILWMLAGLSGESVDTARLLWLHVGLGGFGFAGTLVVGLGFRLDATFHDRPLAPLWMQRAAPVSMAAAGAMLAATFLPWWPKPAGVLLPWAAVALAVAFAVVAMAAGRQSSQPFEPNPRYGRTDRFSDLLIPVVVAYGLVAAAHGLRHGITHPATIHLFLVGFVTTTIYAVSHRILQRFSDMGPRIWLHRTQAWLAIPGPGLLAWGVSHQNHVWGVAGASIEFLAALTYVVMIATALRHKRNRSPVLPIMFTAAIFVLMGMLLGLAFLAHASLRTYLVVHAINNLVGFISLTILGAGSAMLGTAVRPVPGSANRNVWRLAALIAIPLLLWEVLFMFQWPGHEILWFTVLGLGIHAALGLKAVGLRS